MPSRLIFRMDLREGTETLPYEIFFKLIKIFT